MTGRLFLLLTGLMFAGLLGCGDGRPATYPVKGKFMTMDGKPLEGAQVVFHPVNNPNPTYNIVGVVDADGNLKVTTFENGDGAPAGEYILTLTWPTPRRTMMDPDKDRLEGRYSNKDKSTLRLKVEKGVNNEIPLVTVK